MTEYKKEEPRLHPHSAMGSVPKNVEQYLAVAIETLNRILDLDSKKGCYYAEMAKNCILKAWI